MTAGPGGDVRASPPQSRAKGVGSRMRPRSPAHPARSAAHHRPRRQGPEFNHVVVLDRGWNRVGRNEDQDCPRRAALSGHGPLTPNPGPHCRPPDNATSSTRCGHPRSDPRPTLVGLRTPGAELKRRYQRLPLREVLLSFSGYRSLGTQSIGPSPISLPATCYKCDWVPNPTKLGIHHTLRQARGGSKRLFRVTQTEAHAERTLQV